MLICCGCVVCFVGFVVALVWAVSVTGYFGRCCSGGFGLWLIWLGSLVDG